MEMQDLFVFLIGWLICSVVWAIWLDGIYVPAVGLITVLAAIGAFKVVVNLHNK